MLTHSPYYHGSIRKVITAFGSLFSDIHIVRVNDTVSPPIEQSIKVPLSWGSKEKSFVRNIQNPTPGKDDQVQMTLPRMAWEITGFTYDANRKLTSTGNTMKAIINNQSVVKAQFNPVPYNIGFELGIMVKHNEDGLMIVEQILPFFTPDYTVTIKDIPELNLTKNIPFVLNSVSHEDTGGSGDLAERRIITWTLNFTAKAYLYPPTKMSKVILDSTVNILEIEGTDPSAVIHATPEGTTLTENN